MRRSFHARALCALITAWVACSAARAQAFVWARSFGGEAGDGASAVCVDSNGNAVVVGGFQGSADFDPGPGTLALTAEASVAAFVVKLDAAGNLVWAGAINGGGAVVVPTGVAAGPARSVVVTGYFEGVADFDPGPGFVPLDGGEAFAGSAFILKLDADGRFVWVKQLTGGSGVRPNALASDAAGNAVIAGTFYGTADFDPGEGLLELAAAGGSDAFFVKLDPSGGFVWAKRIGGVNLDAAFDVALDAQGSVAAVGQFGGTVNFDPGPGVLGVTATDSVNTFVLKLDSGGNLEWVKHLASPGGTAIAAGPFGNIYVAGQFDGTRDFDPGARVAALTAAGSADAYALKLTAAGDFRWARALGGAEFDAGSDIVINAEGNALIVGTFLGTADFDPGPGEHALASAGEQDLFVASLDGDGGFLWAQSAGGALDFDTATSVAVNASGEALVAGHFLGTVDFDAGPTTDERTSAGDSDAFAWKLDVCPNPRIWNRDADGDGFGDAWSSLAACGTPAGYVSDGSDCDDADAAVRPGASEVCNGRDDDCSGAFDDGGASLCPDANPCTADACLGAEGCAHAAAAGAPCDDANACTSGDACDAAAECVAGVALDCDDHDACSADSCAPAAGCVHTVTHAIFTTASVQGLGGQRVNDGDVLETAACGAGTAISPLARVASAIGINALDVGADGRLLFSVRETGALRRASGLLAVKAENLYSLDPATNEIQTVIDWRALGMAMGNIDAVNQLADGSVVFSTSTLRGVRHAGGFIVLRPENAYRFDPATSAIEPFFDGTALGLDDLDGMNVLPDGTVAFSTRSLAFLRGVSLRPENAYVLAPDGSVTVVFDGEARSLRSLDDFSLRTLTLP